MIVKCSAITCKFNDNYICMADEIELIDFEYYENVEAKEKDRLSDDMKCSTYRSIYREAKSEFII